jgi:predicted 3-demethylubiquinone-9 3-methyltransferase (glyoxalase superfamily)
VVNITPFLWFDHDANEILEFYSQVFENSEVVTVTTMNEPSLPGGGVVIGTIRLENLEITIMNGGPAFTLNEAFSLVVTCQTQEEVNYYWDALRVGGELAQCGWLKDRFGVSWQIVPTLLIEYLNDPDPSKAVRVRDAMLSMIKLDISELQAAYDG